MLGTQDESRNNCFQELRIIRNGLLIDCANKDAIAQASVLDFFSTFWVSLVFCSAICRAFQFALVDNEDWPNSLVNF